MVKMDGGAGLHVPTLIAAAAHARRYADSACMPAQLADDAVSGVFYRIGVEHGLVYVEEVES